MIKGSNNNLNQLILEVKYKNLLSRLINMVLEDIKI